MYNSGSFRNQKCGSNNSNNSDDNFIRFHQTPPSENTFSPQHNSTPLRNRRGNNNWRGRNYYNHSRNESGNSPIFHKGYQPYHKKRNAFNKSSYRDDLDISSYYSHEMVEDPWIALEEKQRNDKIREAKFDEDNKSTTSESSSNNSDTSSSKSDDEL